ncbi:MAG: prepilin-type N-terminal cleavage/methylation domain-containing protein [Verrucomicrobia bacterium]|nr:prepilin-type N-terminal cleavage/methylation domain-containing protein [Verrucomicrobiota bacterium]
MARHTDGSARRARAGFSLLELLVVTMIMAVVVSAIGFCLAGGLRVWDAAQHFGKAESGGLVAMESLCGDLRNTFAFQAIGFHGEPGLVAFPGFTTREDRDAGLRRDLSTVRYYVRDGDLVRETVLYPAGARMAEHLASGVADLRFVYQDSAGETVAATTNLPVWVDIALVLEAGADDDVGLALRRSVRVVAGAAL